MTRLTLINSTPLGYNARRARWRLSSTGEPREIQTPLALTTLSPSGNAWHKLQWFYNEWNGKINWLISMDDLFKAPTPIRKGVWEKGLHQYFTDYVPHVHAYLGRAVATKPVYEDYLKYQNAGANSDGGFPNYSGLFLLDSGGWSYSNPRTRTTDGTHENTVRNNAMRDAAYVELREIMGVLSQEGRHERPDTSLVTEWAERAQTLNYGRQLAAQPDLLATLDHVVPPRAPQASKELYWRFSLTAAVKAAELMREHRDAHEPAVLAVVHPLGPGPADLPPLLTDSAWREVRAAYGDSFRTYLTELERAEDNYGTQFGGLALGSLVVFGALPSPHLQRQVLRAFADAVRGTRFAPRWKHAFGLRYAHEVRVAFACGFDSFDSADPFSLGRLEKKAKGDDGTQTTIPLAYDPGTDKLVHYTAAVHASCACPICQAHSYAEMTEHRRYVAEVGRVLRGLHNFETNLMWHVKEALATLHHAGDD